MPAARSAIEGGTSRQIKAGDVIVIPARARHIGLVKSKLLEGTGTQFQMRLLQKSIRAALFLGTLLSPQDGPVILLGHSYSAGATWMAPP